MPRLETLRRWWSVAPDRLLDLAVGRLCVFCGDDCLADEHLICVGCRCDLPSNDPSCPGCARPLPAALAPGVHCATCQLEPRAYGAAIAPLRYEYPVDAAIRALKFHGRFYYANALAELLVRACRDAVLDVDALLPVPLHWRRQAMRGFNQAEILARYLGKSTGLPLLSGVRRPRATRYQSGLDRDERQRNLAGAFAVRRRPTGRHVLVVDDVMTTGATAHNLASCLLDHGVAAVSVAVLARA